MKVALAIIDAKWSFKLTQESGDCDMDSHEPFGSQVKTRNAKALNELIMSVEFRV